MAIYTGSNKHLGGTETVTRKETFFYGLVQKNVLVTGAKGQLGNELQARTSRMNLPFRFIFTDVDDLDITNIGYVSDYIRHHSVSYIINCAAYTNVEKAETDVETAYLINSKGPENLAKASAQHGCRFIHISTDFVFDGKSNVPYTENSEPNPLSIYGKSKREGEEAILENDPQAIIIRTSWLYSEYGNNFVKTMIRLMSERDELTIVADQHGTPTYAADLAEMIVHILEFSENEEWKPGIYHFSDNGETTWFGFAEKINQLAKLTKCKLIPIKTHEYKTMAERPAYSVMELSKIQSVFHVEIPAWEEALERCMKKLEIRN